MQWWKREIREMEREKMCIKSRERYRKDGEERGYKKKRVDGGGRSESEREREIKEKERWKEGECIEKRERYRKGGEEREF